MCFYRDTILTSELLEESKMSILNKDNDDIKTNGFVHYTFLNGFKLNLWGSLKWIHDY